MRIAVNGVELACDTFGQPGGIPLLTLHGGPGMSGRRGDVATWSSYGERGYQVVCYDQRGSGESEGKPPYSHEQWVADADAMREHFGWDKMVLTGGSYGGHIALEYAVRHPERLLALVLRDTAASNAYKDTSTKTALESNLPGIDEAMLRRLFDGRLASDEEFRQGYAAIQPLYVVDFDPEKAKTQLDQIHFRHETHNWAFSKDQPHYDLRDRLKDIHVPTLVLCGRHDWITPLAASEEIAREIPGARLVVFDHSGHGPQNEEPDRFHQVVGDFLREVVPGAA